MAKNVVTLQTVQTLQELQKLNPSFEEVYAELQNIVNSQQNQQLSLQQSIDMYKLSKIYIEYCSQILNQATLEIEKIENSTK